MKQIGVVALLAVILWHGCSQAPQAPQAETKETQEVPSTSGTTLKLLPQESKIIAIGTKVTGRHEIAFPIKEGSLIVGEDGCVSGGTVKLDLAGLEVLDLQGEWKEKLEKHLRSEDFFLTEKYPEGLFEITGCQRATGDTVLLSGNLTLRGQTKNITFPAIIHLHQNTLHAQASFNINRQEWGIAYKGKADDLIRDEVNISLEVSAQQ